MNPLPPLVLLALGLAGAVWFGLEQKPLLFGFFAFVVAVGLYELHATLAHNEKFEE